MKRNDDIKEYLHGNRKGEAANRLEREALSDPFLFEALEGLTDTPGDPIDGLIRLERQLNERNCASRKRRGWLYMAASFAVLAICGTLWLTLSRERDVVSDQQLARLPDSAMAPGRDTSAMSLAGGTASAGATDSIKERVAEARVMTEADDSAVIVPISQVLKKDSLRMARRATEPVGHVVEGVVADDKGEPIPGVTVVLSGTDTEVLTDGRGHFRISLTGAKGNLTFHFAGMKPLGYDVSAGDRVEVKMEADQKSSDEAMVTGYRGVEKRSAVGTRTGAVADSSIDARDVDYFNRYLDGALKYPAEDLEKNNEGVIQLSFELNKKNTPSRIRITDGFSKESNKEIIRLLSQGPRWENSASGKRIYAIVRFVIGKGGQKHKVVLVIEKQKE